ncbi:MAG: 4-hydroxybutyrate dehydrogenase [Firmicutes bacterium]|nr:4-hydroxybutyrate dehydrogenase [Bacillota bacterium]MBQ3610676.1 4-hydroxybutyrate dehydrogenase [Bacillota bacterium]MBR1993528.1 4-hydroxybutyrate dehydrogenase [Bacillota bacterium]MBR3787427.1 4-hydroxybutyrate dehydrogenase [Bacillota bacterium]MBR6798830.1 4-hydroxybutyrate dehydrogenase [Bacillota bacterium]
MQALRVVPAIHYFDTFKEFNEEFKLGKGDILVTNQWMYDPYVKPLGIDIPVIYQEKYGAGEPTDEMMDAMKVEMDQYEYDRIIAFGGGTIVDICKVLACEIPDKAADLYTGKIEAKRIKELVLVPTTCGTGSEVTNVAVASIPSLNLKKGIATEETYADHAVLIPESLAGLPDKVFATSSVDALIHAVESFLSPKASPFTEMYSLKAIEMIMEGYKKIIERGGNSKENRADLLKDFALASNYAGIAFGNAGCGAVHALSYAHGGAFHIPHGEANFICFTEVFKMYMRKQPVGKIQEANKIFANVLGCAEADVYPALDEFLGKLIELKPLREYGMTEDQVASFAKSTVDNQQRLLGNNYVPLTEEEIAEIFQNLY